MPQAWEVLRVRTFIRHSTPTSCSITREYTLRNLLDKFSAYVAFLEEEPCSDIHFHDADGSELAVVPSAEVVATLRQSSDPLERERADRIATGKAFYPMVMLPAETVIPKNQLIVLSYTFTGNNKPSELPQGPLSLFFNIPSYEVKLHLAEAFHGSTHLVITAPEGADLKPSSVGLYPDDGNAQRRKRWREKPPPLPQGSWIGPAYSRGVLHVSIPSGTRGLVCTKYSIQPEKEELRLFGGSFLIVTAAALMVWMADSGWFAGIHSPGIATFVEQVAQHHLGLLTGLSALVVVYVGLVTNPLTHRTKFWMFVPLVIAALAALGVVI